MATLRRLLPNAPGVLNAPAPRKEVTEHVKSDVMSAIVNGQTALVEELLLGYPDLVRGLAMASFLPCRRLSE